MIVFGFSRDEVAAMGDPQFADFMNTLLWAEYSALGVKPSDIRENWKHYSSDGGIDHGGSLDLTVDRGSSRWIPADNTVWQYKAGRSFNVNDIKGELIKKSHEAVRQRVKAGATYVLVVPNWDDTKKTDGRKKIAEVFSATFDDPFPLERVCVYTAPDVSEWSYARPHVSLRFGKDPGGFQLLKDVPLRRLLNGHSGLEVEFIGSARIRQAETIQSFALHHKGELEVRGSPGMGKTRLVVQALSPEGLQERVIYAHNISVVQTATQLKAQLSGKEAGGTILVVDNVDAHESRGFLEYLNPVQENNLVILVTSLKADSEGFMATPNPITLSRLSDIEITEIITSITGYAQDIAVQIAKHLDGTPALAVTVADILAQGASDWSSVITSPQLGSHIVSRVEPKLRQSLQVLSLVPRTTIQEDGFAAVIWKELGFPLGNLTECARQAVDLGIIEKARGQLFFRSALMASWFARRAWEEWAPKIEEIYLGHPHLQNAIIEVAGSLPGVPAVEAFANRVVGGTDFLGAQIFGNDEAMIQRLSALASGFPDLVARIVRIRIQEVEEDYLLNFKNGRGTLIAFLTEILWDDPSKFTLLAPVFKALARTETTDYSNSNNAEGIWGHLFQVHTGPGGQATAANRMAYARTLLDGQDLLDSLLAVKAVQHALEHSETGPLRPSGRHQYYMQRAEPQGFPENAVASAARSSALEIIRYALVADEEELVTKSWDALMERAWDLGALGRIKELIEIIGTPSVAPSFIASEKARHDVLRTLGIVRESLERVLSQEERELIDATLQAWQPADLHSLVRRMAGEWLHTDWEDARRPESQFNQGKQNLVTELIAAPDALSSEMPWLLTWEAQHSFELGCSLGLEDTKQRVAPAIFRKILENSNVGVQVGYLWGRYSRGDIALVHARLSDLGKQPPAMDILGWLIPYTKEDNFLTNLVVDSIKCGSMTSYGYRNLGLGDWYERISLPIAKDLVLALLSAARKDKKGPRELLVTILLHRSASDGVLVWATEIRDAIGLGTEDVGTIGMHEWFTLLGRITEVDPNFGISALLRFLMGESRYGSHPYDANLMTNALKRHPETFLELLSNAVKSSMGYVLEIWLDFNRIDSPDIPSVPILAWVKTKGVEGARLVSSLIGPHGTRIDEPVATIIIEYGFDSQVMTNFEKHVWPHSWTGSYADVLRSSKDMVYPWTEVENQGVANWAKDLVKRLEKEIDRQQEIEVVEDRFGF